MSLEIFVDESSLWGTLPRHKKEVRKTVKATDLSSILADKNEPTTVRSANSVQLAKKSRDSGPEVSNLHVFDAYQSNKVLGLTKQLEITSKKDSYKVNSKGFDFLPRIETFFGAIFPENEQVPRVFSVSISGSPVVVEFSDKKKENGERDFKTFKKLKDIPPFVQYEKVGSHTVIATLGATNTLNPNDANLVQVFSGDSRAPGYSKKYLSLGRAQQDKLTVNPGE